MEDYHYDSDSGNESSDDDVELEFDSEGEGSGSGNRFAKDNDDYPYEVLSTEEVSRHMLDCIKEFITVSNISHTTARLLLSHFRWDKEKLMERFYDSDQEKLFKEAQVPSPFKKLPKSEPVVKGSTGMEECSICCLNMPPKLMFGLDCAHRFCSNCWCEYITTKVIDEGTGQSISCAGHDCHVIIEDSTVMTLLQDAKVKLTYQHRIAQSFVECNRQLRWCPYPDCKYVVKVQYPCARPVVCRCHNVFCFSCGNAWHDPVKCPLLKRWIKKCDDDSETSNWISANTKECPKCKVTIEKDGGCNHMVCKNVACKSEFCWVCLGPWEPHGSSWYSCNRYDEFEAKQARDAQEKSRSALQRYLFYYNRYMNHMQSLKLENKLNLTVKEKMDEMQQHNMSWIEVQFLQKAVDILGECRQTLMYTYVFAYYLHKNNQSVIFEDNQRDLEASTEKLSEYLERDMQDSVDDIKQKVQDKYRYCEQRRKKLLEHVHEGYDQEWWEYKYGA